LPVCDRYRSPEKISFLPLSNLLNSQIAKTKSMLPDAPLGPDRRVMGTSAAETEPCTHVASMEDVAMRTTFDFSPLFRSSIGFDRLLNALDAASRVETIDNWPPYDIAKTGEDDYRITMAVAGFSQDELDIAQEQNMLVVSGQKAGEDDGQYLHRGIAGRTFRRRFELADHVKVVGAGLVNGLLTIDLKREIPEAMKPRRIEIAAEVALPPAETKQIEAEQHAA
jgi:molecular chaperone IbpA